MNKEPAVILGLIGAAAAAVLGILVVFYVPINQAQQDAILGAIGPVGLLIIALITRQWVTPEMKARDREQAALRQARAELSADPPSEEI